MEIRSPFDRSQVTVLQPPRQAPATLPAPLGDGQPNPVNSTGKQTPGTENLPAPGFFRSPLTKHVCPGCPLGLAQRHERARKSRKSMASTFSDWSILKRHSISLLGGRVFLILKAIPKRIQVAEEKVANYAVITPTELSLQGRQIGTTVLTIWFADAADPNKQKVLSYLVRVLPDPEAKERLEKVYEELAKEINHAFPDSHVRLTLAGDKLLVCGQAKDIVEATQILQIARANAPPDDASRIPVGQVNLVVQPGALADGADPSTAQSLENYLVRGSPASSICSTFLASSK